MFICASLGLPQTIVVRLTLLRHSTDRLAEEERLGDREAIVRIWSFFEK